LNALQSDLGAGYSPGIVAVHPSRLDNLEEPLATIDLSAYFDDPTWGFSSEEAADFVPVFLNSFRTDEMLHALPIVPSAMVLFYNQTWGEELGFSEPPRTEANFTAVNCASTQMPHGLVNENCRAISAKVGAAFEGQGCIKRTVIPSRSSGFSIKGAGVGSFGIPSAVSVAVGTVFSVALGSMVGFEVSEGVFGAGEGVPKQLVIARATIPSNKIPCR
jgi:hypothetical protein